MIRIMMLCFLSLILVGCVSNKELNKDEIMEVKPSKLPKVRAFQDESTRKFMHSTKEVADGYYLFEPVTNKYIMHFPKDMLVLDTLIGKGKKSEITTFIYPYKVQELSDRGNELTLYLKPYGKDKDLLSLIPIYPDTDTNYVENMEEIDLDDVTIYHTQIKRNAAGGGHHQYIVGIIGSKEVPQAIYFEISLGIYPENEGLSKGILDQASEELLALLKTVKFKHN